MSISSMTDLAFARRTDVEPDGRGIQTLDEVAAEKGQKKEAATTATSALASIAAYLPSEIITIYVAVLATLGIAIDAGGDANQAAATPIEPYLVFAVLTPLVVWGLYAAKAATAGKPLPRSLAAWPKWEMAAATLAFAVWAAALPSSPLERFDWFTSALAGVAALVVSMLLGIFAPLFSRSPLASR